MTNFWLSVAGGKFVKEASWRKGGLLQLLVVRCKLGRGLPGGSAGVSEEGRSGKLWVELVHQRRDGEPPDQAAV